MNKHIKNSAVTNHFAVVEQTGKEIDTFNFDNFSYYQLEKMRKLTLICPDCGEKVHLRKIKYHVYAYGTHKENCKYNKKGKEKVIHVGGDKFQIRKMLTYAGLANGINTNAAGNSDVKETDTSNEQSEVIVDNKKRNSKSLKNLTIYIEQSGLNESIETDLEEEVRVDDLIVDRRNVDYKRFENLSGFRVFIARRVRVNDKMVPIKDYCTQGRDWVLVTEEKTSGTKERDKIYLIIRFLDARVNKEFKDHLFGDKRKNDDSVALLGHWESVDTGDNSLHIYKAILNAKCFYFFDSEKL